MKVMFTVSGWQFELTAQEVEAALATVEPERAFQHVVEVNGQLYPVKQAFQVAIGHATSEAWDRLDYTSAEARRVLKALGFRTRRITDT